MRTWPLSAAFAILLLVGCSSDGKKKNTEPDPTLYLSQTSVTNILANLIRAYDEKNATEYTKLFDPSYRYTFAPQDIGGPNHIPAAWGRDEEITSATHMLGGTTNADGYMAEEITLSFTVGVPTGTAIDSTWTKVVLSNINLSVVGRQTSSQDPLIYQVIGDKADLYFVETDETAPGSNLKTWKIVRWDDKPIARAGPATNDTTWGLIKALWM
jgi:hypothetical protein